MLPNRILYYAKMLQTSGKRACSCFPSAATSYANIVKDERNDKAEKPCFYSFGTAEPHPILCKDVANEWNESCFHIPECSYILCKDVANEWNESCFHIPECSYILCKDVANEWNESCFHIPECSYILCKCTKKNLQSNKIRLNFIPNRLFDFIYISCQCQTYWLPVLSEI